MVLFCVKLVALGKSVTEDSCVPFHYCDGVCGTAAANGPVIPPQTDTRVNVEKEWYDSDGRQPKNAKKTCPNASLSTTNAT